MRPFQLRTLKEIARDLTRSSLSLSSNSSECSNLSVTLSGSTPSLAMASRISLKRYANMFFFSFIYLKKNREITQNGN